MRRLALLVFILGCAECAGQEPGPAQERFLHEAPIAWAKYQARAARTQGRYLLGATLEGKEIGRERVEFKQAPGCALMTRQYLPPLTYVDGKTEVANPKYRFELRRTTEEKPWAVSGVAMVGGDAGGPTASAFIEAERLANTPVTLFMVSDFEPAEKKGAWPTALREPGFSVKSVSVLAHNGTECVKVEFAYNPGGKSQRVPTAVAGWAVFDPKRFWSVQEDEYRLDWGTELAAIYASKLHYSVASDGFPTPKRLEIKQTNPRTAKVKHLIFEFEVREAGLLVEDFTLAAFGFPEPVGVNWPKPTRWWVWISLGAACSVALAGFLRILTRRLQKPSRPDTAADPKVGVP